MESVISVTFLKENIDKLENNRDAELVVSGCL